MRETTRTRPRWLLREPAPDARALLFCVPYAGTGASMYHRWPRRIGLTEVCPIQLPARENRLREPAYRTYEELADQLIDGLARHLDRPFAFISHCGSVCIGLETTIRLMERGGPAPAHFFASSMVAPCDPFSPSILEVDDDGLGDVVEDLMRARGADPLPELVEMARHIMRADVDAYRRYHRPSPVRLPCPVTVIGWRDDDQIPPELTHGWSAYGDKVSHHLLEGEHWSFLQATPALIRLVDAAMSQAADAAS